MTITVNRTLTKRKNCNTKSDDWNIFYGDHCAISKQNELIPTIPLWDESLNEYFMIDFLTQYDDIYNSSNNNNNNNSHSLCRLQNYVSNVYYMHDEPNEQDVVRLIRYFVKYELKYIDNDNNIQAVDTPMVQAPKQLHVGMFVQTLSVGIKIISNND